MISARKINIDKLKKILNFKFKYSLARIKRYYYVV